MKVICTIRERPGKPVIRIGMQSEGGTTLKITVRSGCQAEMDGAMRMAFAALAAVMGKAVARQTCDQLLGRLAEIQEERRAA